MLGGSVLWTRMGSGLIELGKVKRFKEEGWKRRVGSK